ncbi:MAG: 2-oxo acid dehydrogenase subunit E2, partial [Acidobacteria bacterium]|nr:2-oxo acid dehydrogenase subunit E2 [Acidobacteriota bacterium]
KAPVVDEKTHEIKVEDVIDFGFTIDERISEGFSLGEVLQDFRKFIENPELLTQIPLIPEDRLEELQLKNLEDDPLYKNNQAASG